MNITVAEAVLAFFAYHLGVVTYYLILGAYYRWKDRREDLRNQQLVPSKWPGSHK